MKIRKIIIAEKDPIKRGDLFGRLIGDLFHSLGYNESRYNIHLAGREIDLRAEHRFESKIAIAECKATIKPVGGADINKFIGVLDAERRTLKRKKHVASCVGYYISLSGYTETAIEQEEDFETKRLSLLNAVDVIKELIKGKIIVNIHTAIQALNYLKNFKLIPYADLVATNEGWIWSCYFSDNEIRPTHVAFVHAEGRQLLDNLAHDLRHSNEEFVHLDLIPNKSSIRERVVQDTRNLYYKYLETELGAIQFEGMPTDQDMGTVKVNLENIFVPLHLLPAKREGEGTTASLKNARVGIGEVLKSCNRLAILARPGGGKSTLVKRLAIAYAFPARRKLIKDKLPDKSMFPLFIRCRELGSLANASITTIIHNIPLRAEIPEYLDAFKSLASDALQNGTALIMIDGLDEITDDKLRVSFANQLRTFLGIYPSVSVIVTSREAGFRIVGGSLASYCSHYTIAGLNKNEIEELILKWHHSVIDTSSNTTEEAKKLSIQIIQDTRIRVLAENPLLLTTLLFVKRWAGYLPTKRHILYQEMIKLLLVTWNVQGHGQLDIEEAEPQLAYIAYWMTKEGRQIINEDELIELLRVARQEMPEILVYTQISPKDFVKQVESRSSLLIQSGLTQTKNGLTPIYEFLHLSFQEYLTAKAIIKGFVPRKDLTEDPIDSILPYLYNDSWKEIIPIIAVMLERKSKRLIEIIINDIKEGHNTPTDSMHRAASLLASCLANEVQIDLPLLKQAIEWYGKTSYAARGSGSVETLLKTKFGKIFSETIKESFVKSSDDAAMLSLGTVLSEIISDEIGYKSAHFNEEVIKRLSSNNTISICEGLLALMHSCYRSHIHKDLHDTFNTNILELLITHSKSKNRHIQICVAWCLAWAAQTISIREIYSDKLTSRLIYQLTQEQTSNSDYRRIISWAVSCLIHPSANITVRNKSVVKEFLTKLVAKPINEHDSIMALLVGPFIGLQWSTKEIKNLSKGFSVVHHTEMHNKVKTWVEKGLLERTVLEYIKR